MAQVSFYKINNNQLNSVPIAEGQVIFVQDTGELYIDKDSSHRVQISNGNAIENLIDDVAIGSIKGIGTNGSFGEYSFSEGSGTVACGNNSHAEGKDTAAIDNYSHVEGQGGFDITTITGDANATTYSYDNTNIQLEEGTFIVLPNLGIAKKIYSVDIENATFTVTETLSSVTLSNEDCFVYYGGVADGIGAHSEGYQTLALANGAHAEGWNTTASWEYSHAEGNNTAASYIGAHAEGGHTKASGMYSHAEGLTTIAKGNYSHAEGNTVISYGTGSHAEGYCTVYDDYSFSGAANATTYTISFDPEEVDFPEVGDIIINGTIMSAITAVDWTNMTVTVNNTLSNIALDYEQINVIRSGLAYGDYSHVEGLSNRAYGVGSHVEGNQNRADGDYSHSEGMGNWATGEASHAEGYGNGADGNYSHAEGYGSRATGTAAHAEGEALASGYDSHAEGQFTHATGNYSHAEGIRGIASGIAAHVEGFETLATKKYQHVQGKYNIEDPGDTNDATMSRYAHIIGNGTANNARSNAHTIDWAGNAWFAGDIKIGGTSYDNATTVIAGPASSTTLGGLKVRYDATTQTLYIRNDGQNA